MIALALLIFALIFAALLYAGETGVFYLNRLRLRTAVEQGRSSARFLLDMNQHPANLIVAVWIGGELAIAAAGAGFALWLDSTWLPAVGVALLAMGLGFLPFDVLARRLPMRWMERTCDWSAYHLAPLLRAWIALCRKSGLSHLVSRVGRPSAVAGGGEAISEIAHLRFMGRLRERVAERDLSSFQREMLDRFMNLTNIRVSSVMIPRARSATLSVGVSRDDFLRVAKMAHFSRIPVYDVNPRRITGIVNVYDVLTDHQVSPISTYVQPVIRLAPSESVASALWRLRQARQSMAVVQDRAGNCEGILTVKDLVEEIVGELEAW